MKEKTARRWLQKNQDNIIRLKLGEDLPKKWRKQYVLCKDIIKRAEEKVGSGGDSVNYQRVNLGFNRSIIDYIFSKVI